MSDIYLPEGLRAFWRTYQAHPIFAPDNPLVLDGTYDIYGYTPKDRRAQQRKRIMEGGAMKKPKGKTKKVMAKAQFRKAARKTVAAKVPARSGRSKPPVKRARVPRAVPLPGMEDVRIKELDDLAHDMVEAREAQNAAHLEEEKLDEKIVKALHKHGKSIWKAAGIELALIPGGERLRKRLVKDKTEHASVESPPPPQDLLPPTPNGAGPAYHPDDPEGDEEPIADEENPF